MIQDVPPRVMTIAGSDSGGGAGIEADLKTFTALRVYGMVAITSVTAQNTLGVHGVHDIPPEMVAKQIDVVAQDIGIDAAKTGMLSNAAIIEAVTGSLKRNRVGQLVLDPVMVSESRHSLLEPSAIKVLVEHLFPLALVVTPNIPEAEAITKTTIKTEEDMREAAKAIHELGPRYVLIKGGHADTPEAIDYLYDGETWIPFSAPRIDTVNTHGTGCTYAAAIAAYLGKGHPVPEAVRLAKDYVTQALGTGLNLGHGPGPLNHFWALGKDE